MTEKNTPSTGNIGFCGALTLIFITLKLIDVIDWSWFWVLSPIIIPFVLYVFFIFIAITLSSRN